MNARCGKSLLRTLRTTIAPGRTYRWEKTRQSHDRFNRLKRDRLWRSVRSVDCTIATNARPRTTKSSPPTQKAQTSPGGDRSLPFTPWVSEAYSQTSTSLDSVQSAAKLGFLLRNHRADL